MNKLKKTLALLLSLVMILSLLPAAAFAVDELPEEVSEVMKEEAQAEGENVAEVTVTEPELPEAKIDTYSGEALTLAASNLKINVAEMPVTYSYEFLSQSEALGNVKLNTVWDFIPKESGEVASASFYSDWKCDFTVSFDKKVAANSVGLYGAYAYNPVWRFGFLLDQDIPANERFYLLKTAGIGDNFDYSAIVNNVREFLCTAFSTSHENDGTEITVELVLYKGDVVHTVESVNVSLSTLFTPLTANGTDYVYYGSGLHEGAMTVYYNNLVDATVSGPHFATADAKSYVAQIDSTKYETLADAITAAKANDTIILLADLENIGKPTIPAGVTLDGGNHKITGNSAFTLGDGATVTNVYFKNITDGKTKTSYNKKGGTLTALYGSGNASVTDCTFENCSWDAIQFTPVAGKEITITGNTFKTTDESYGTLRYVHVQSAKNVDFTVTVTGNKFYNCDKLDQTGLEVYYPTDANNVTLSGNYMDSPMAVCIGTGGTSYNNATAEALPFKDETLQNDVNVVASILDGHRGDVLYTSLADAIAAVPANGTKTTITMIGDEAVVAGVTVAANQNVVLELNGHTVSGNTDSTTTYALITNRGTLTIQDNTDTKKDGTGTGLLTTYITNPDEGDIPGYASNTITNNGTLTVKSGKIVNNGEGYACYAIDNQTNGTAYDPVLNIEGGRMEQMNAYTYAVRMFCNSTTNVNTVNVSGGVITGGYGLWLQAPNNKANKAALNISGGTIDARDGYALYADGGSTVDMSQTSVSISGGTIEGTGVGLYSDTAYKSLTVSDGYFKLLKVSAIGGNSFVSGGYYSTDEWFNKSKNDSPAWGRDSEESMLAQGYVVAANTDEATKDQYPYKVQLKAFEVDKDNSFNTKTDVKDLVDVADVVAVVTDDISTATDITISVAVNPAAEAPTAVTTAAGTAGIAAEKTFEVHPVVTFTKTVNNEVVDVATVANASEYVKEGASFTFTVTGLKSNHRYTIYHYDASGKLEDTFNNVLTDADGNATVTLSSFSYLLAEDAGEITCAGYLQTANADILSSLMWNLYFHIDDYENLSNPRILVTSEYDPIIDGVRYEMTYDSTRKAYCITVPIRPRLIDQEVGFTLVDDNGTYSLRFGSASGTEYVTIPFSFNQYLNTVKTTSNGEPVIIPGLRAWRDVLLSVWSAEKYR